MRCLWTIRASADGESFLKEHDGSIFLYPLDFEYSGAASQTEIQSCLLLQTKLNIIITRERLTASFLCLAAIAVGHGNANGGREFAMFIATCPDDRHGDR